MLLYGREFWNVSEQIKNSLGQWIYRFRDEYCEKRTQLGEI